ncbi:MULTISPECIES: aspartate/glutamate racemase family protein [unclassified Arsukibacterium]|uniref:aspartate/glutamate racemase family protein n=1 Tax=unclassified Arsukibacterium TaxID=2635278 RepID=UPI000C45223F|nr:MULTISPECIES: aspartate/glutamate racemase family protein [unclassified Arsukibacterium]MAA94590.1 hypothetical protein [Rheinheimera sp.]MBM32827.1 hypothetical protein [Rheinheimera sp.]|tara:strand:+ start:1669 stop:2043 length:375 start_codon:yes stop_codon:yes gene_type:complete
MKTIGLLGGMSWESTIPYYGIINETVKQQLGGLHSAKVILYSVNFAEVEQMQCAGDWQAAGQLLAESREQYRQIIGQLIDQGAEAIILGCTEISLLVSQQDSVAPLFDTTGIHARSTAELALRS